MNQDQINPISIPNPTQIPTPIDIKKQILYHGVNDGFLSL
jgi:hypothetical protein